MLDAYTTLRFPLRRTPANATSPSRPNPVLRTHCTCLVLSVPLPKVPRHSWGTDWALMSVSCAAVHRKVKRSTAVVQEMGEKQKVFTPSVCSRKKRHCGPVHAKGRQCSAEPLLELAFPVAAAVGDEPWPQCVQLRPTCATAAIVEERKSEARAVLVFNPRIAQGYPHSGVIPVTMPKSLSPQMH